MLTVLDTISLLAPAKINLALHVTGQRSDGYHLLSSLVVFACFGDVIRVSKAEVDTFRISGPYGTELPRDGANLVLKARDSLRRYFPTKALPVAIHLEKHLPVASGIGGGSSDAAAALRALAALWDISLEPWRLAAIALTLGADVPMCLHSQPLIATGIGDVIEHIGGLPRLPLVLVNNGVMVSTSRVFAALVNRDNPPLPALPSLNCVDDVCAYLGQTDNHLFSAAEKLSPGISDAIKAIHDTIPRFVRMSGSGGTCFALYDNNDSAQAACVQLRQSHPSWFIVATNSFENSDSN